MKLVKMVRVHVPRSNIPFLVRLLQDVTGEEDVDLTTCGKEDRVAISTGNESLIVEGLWMQNKEEITINWCFSASNVQVTLLAAIAGCARVQQGFTPTVFEEDRFDLMDALRPEVAALLKTSPETAKPFLRALLSELQKK